MHMGIRKKKKKRAFNGSLDGSVLRINRGYIVHLNTQENIGLMHADVQICKVGVVRKPVARLMRI